jgi:hypothetical protein
MFVSGKTTEVEANMLKGIVSQLQLNTQAVNLVKNRHNNLPEPDSDSAQYSVMEVSYPRLGTHNSACQHTPQDCKTGKFYVLLLISYARYMVHTAHHFILVYVRGQESGT